MSAASGMLRSAAMTPVRLVLPPESAPAIIEALGEFGDLHFMDAGEPSTEVFKIQKQRLSKISTVRRRLDALLDLMPVNGVVQPLNGADLDPNFRYKGDCLEAVEDWLRTLESDLSRDIAFQKEQRTKIAEEHERLWVLSPYGLADQAVAPSSSTYGSFDDVEVDEGEDDEEEALLKQGFTQVVQGVIATHKKHLFERMLFRVSRGNIIASFDDIPVEIEDPATGEKMNKCVFRLMMMGTGLESRARKMCAAYEANVYDIPKDARGRQKMKTATQNSLAESQRIRDVVTKRIKEVLLNVSPAEGPSPWVNWMCIINKEERICDVLMRMNTLSMERAKGSLVGYAWLPSDRMDALESILRGFNSRGHAVAFTEMPASNPPTYFKTTKFTDVFQVIIDTYGNARYQEVNPALFTIITFPFQFGVMYGDILHGFIVFLVGLWMLLSEKKFLKQKKEKGLGEIFGMLFGGRYMVLLMGIFACYCGFIYNDCASLSLYIWPSRWSHPEEGSTMQILDGVYPLGLDPKWQGSSNGLLFQNSFKMKISVIIGVVQMFFGVCLGLLNDLYFGDWAAVIFEFIPRALFLGCTFGYMDWMIFYKWCKDWSHSSTSPPGIIQTMIGMFLRPGQVSPDEQLYEGQAQVQVILLLIVVCCIPIMFLAPPLVANCQFKARYGKIKVHVEDDLEGHYGAVADRTFKFPEIEHDDHGVGPHYSFGDHVVNNGIHSIEFILGCVSNTASYLRLWALSLAHAQLAEVFWQHLLQAGFNMTGLMGYVGTFIGFAAWMIATVGVLLCMDSLECFLHALRLHWVEFQNKFYHADGHPYEPFNYKNLRQPVFD